MKGKFEARVEVKTPTKDSCTFEEWTPKLPETFPKENDSKIYIAKWERFVRVKITGDERVKVVKPEYIDIPINTPKVIWNIKTEILAKVSLADGWSNEDYCFYDWRIGGETGEEMQDYTQIKEDMTVYARTNYKRFKLLETKLQGYEGEKPRGRIFIPKETTSIAGGVFKGCDELTNVNFNACKELTIIRGFTDFFGNSSGVFEGCTGLESVDLSNCTKLKIVGQNIFSYCTNLKTVNLSGCTELTSIGTVINLSSQETYDTFYRCTALKSVNLSGCTKLNSIEDR